MRIFKTKGFHRWAAKEGLNDTGLVQAIEEICNGLIDADLGGHVIKKRIALPGRGKRGSVRTILAFKREHHVFFVYGFTKNARANISDTEVKALRHLAAELLSYKENQLHKAIKASALVEVETDDE